MMPPPPEAGGPPSADRGSKHNFFFPRATLLSGRRGLSGEIAIRLAFIFWPFRSKVWSGTSGNPGQRWTGHIKVRGGSRLSVDRKMEEPKQDEKRALKMASLSLDNDCQQGEMRKADARTSIVYMIDATGSMNSIISDVSETVYSTVAFSQLMPRTDVTIIIYKDYDTDCNGLIVHRCDTVQNTQSFLQEVLQKNDRTNGGCPGYEASASGLLVALDSIDTSNYSGALIYNITDEDGRFYEDVSVEKSREIEEFNKFVDLDRKSLDKMRFRPSSIIQEFHEKNVKFLTLMCVADANKSFLRSHNAGYLQLEKTAIEYEKHVNSTIHRVCVLETCRQNIKEVALDVIMTDIARSSSHSSFGMQVDLQSMFGQDLRNVNGVKATAPDFGLVESVEDFNRKYVNTLWFNKNPRIWKRDSSNPLSDTDTIFFFFTIYPTNTIESKYQHMSFFALDETLALVREDSSLNVQKIMYQKAASIVELLSENQDLCAKLAGIPTFCSIVTSFIESHGRNPMNCTDHKVSQIFKTLMKKHSRRLPAYYLSGSGATVAENRDTFSSLKSETAKVYAQGMIATTVASTHNTTEVNPLTDTIDVGLFYLDNENDRQQSPMPPAYELLNVRGPRITNWMINFLKRVRHQNKTDNKIGLGVSADGKKLICIPAYEFCHRSDSKLKYSPLQVIFTLLDKDVTLRDRTGFNLLLVASLVVNNSAHLCPELVKVAETTLSHFDFEENMFDENSCLLPCFFSNEHRNLLIQERTLGQIKSQTVINQLMASSQLEKAMLICKKQSSFTHHQKQFKANVTWYEKPDVCELKTCKICKMERLASDFIDAGDVSCGYCMCSTVDSRIGEQVCKAFDKVTPGDIQNYYAKKPNTSRHRCRTFGALLEDLGHKDLETTTTTTTASETSSKGVCVVRLACRKCSDLYPVIHFYKAPRYSKNHLCPKCRLLKALTVKRTQKMLAIYALFYSQEQSRQNQDRNVRHSWNISYILHHIDALNTITANHRLPEFTEYLKKFLLEAVNQGTSCTWAQDTPKPQMEIESQQIINEYRDATLSELMTPDQFDQLISYQTGLQNLDLLKGSWSNIAQLPTSYAIMKTLCQSARLYADPDERKLIVEDGLWLTRDTAKTLAGEILGETISEFEFLRLNNCNACLETNIGTLYNVHCKAMLCFECVQNMLRRSSTFIHCPICRTKLTKNSPTLSTVVTSLLNTDLHGEVRSDGEDDDDDADDDDDDDNDQYYREAAAWRSQEPAPFI